MVGRRLAVSCRLRNLIWLYGGMVYTAVSKAVLRGPGSNPGRATTYLCGAMVDAVRSDRMFERTCGFDPHQGYIHL